MKEIATSHLPDDIQIESLCHIETHMDLATSDAGVFQFVKLKTND